MTDLSLLGDSNVTNPTCHADQFSAAELVDLSRELHERLLTQARNLLMEYRMGSKMVPVDEVERLMRVYGTLIAAEIFSDQEAHRRMQEELHAEVKRTMEPEPEFKGAEFIWATPEA